MSRFHGKKTNYMKNQGSIPPHKTQQVREIFAIENYINKT